MMKLKNESRHGNAVIVGSLLILSIVMFWSVDQRAVADDSPSDTVDAESLLFPDNTVTFFEQVSPDAYGIGDTPRIGTRQTSLDELNEAIRPSGGHVLIVTSITAYHINPTGDSSFSAISLIGLTESGGTLSFGTTGISVSGTETTQVNYDPGVVVKLTENSSLTFRSFSQSNDIARVGLHGYLMEYPTQ